MDDYSLSMLQFFKVHAVARCEHYVLAWMGKGLSCLFSWEGQAGWSS